MGFDLDNFLPYQLSQVANKISRDLADHYQEAYDLTRTQWRIMAVLSGRAQTAQSVADKTVMDKSVISRAVKKLIGRNYIKRGVSQSDGRLAPLELTDEGRVIFDAISKVALQYEQHLISHLTQTDLQHLDRLLQRLQRRVDE